ncbi:MAG: hypothetical protein M1814_005927 [Vezdaea aestivalis]|nr:MAG: hypothetical protein M1814_005927 [Vezdaea aestivalis]
MTNETTAPSPPNSKKTDSPTPGRPNHAVQRLRFICSAQEYGWIYKYALSRSKASRHRMPLPDSYEAFLQSKGDDFNAAAVRIAVRVFGISLTGLEAWELIKRYLAARKAGGKAITRTSSKVPFLKSPNLKLSLSVSMILLFHRLLYRFFSRLRANLLTQEAKPFRRRNPRISKALVSRFAPAIGASFSGFLLGIYPKDQLRITAAIFTLSRSIEFLWNKLELKGYTKGLPSWFGAWMLMPLSCGQLLHAFIFDRDCFPDAYADFTMSRAHNYIQKRPQNYPRDKPWPTTAQTINSLSTMASLGWPPFISPILFPPSASSAAKLPASLSFIEPLTSSAHPLHTSLSCAALHPSIPSCATQNFTYHLHAFPQLFRFFAGVYALFSIPKYRTLLSSPLKLPSRVLYAAARTSAFLSLAMGTSWGSICLFQALFPGRFLQRERFFLSGFLGGLAALVDRKGGKSIFLYSTRASVDSTWKVGVKRGWWRGFKNGDVWVFVAAAMLANCMYESEDGEETTDSGLARRLFEGLRGRGWKDPLRGVDPSHKVKEQ